MIDLNHFWKNLLCICQRRMFEKFYKDNTKLSKNKNLLIYWYIIIKQINLLIKINITN